MRAHLSTSLCRLPMLQALLLDNPHGFPVDYELSLSSQVFSVSPAAGTIKPRSSCQVSVKWTPGSAACKAAAKQVPAQQSEGAGGVSKPAAVAAAGGVGALPRRLSKAGSTSAGKLGTTAAVAAAGAVSSKGTAAKQVPADAAHNAKAAPDSSIPAGAGPGSTIPTNNNSITVQLPAGAAASAPVAAGAVGCTHMGYLVLKLRGGGDVPPKKVMLYGELPASLLKFTVKEINLGPVPLFEQQTTLVQIKNMGSTDAAYRVSRRRHLFP